MLNRGELLEKLERLVATMAPDAVVTGVARAQGGYDLRIRVNGTPSSSHFLSFEAAAQDDERGTTLMKQTLTAALAEVGRAPA